MKTKGLYFKARENERAAVQDERTARHPHTDPRIAYDAGVAAERCRKEAAEALQTAQANEELHQKISLLLHDVVTSKIQTRYRKLVATALEEAMCWLARENGDEEANLKMVK